MSATAQTFDDSEFDKQVARGVDRALLRNIPGLSLPSEEELAVGLTPRELVYHD
ncbi:MAG: hypothetical protein ACI9BW_002904, partial [Gammaproteobacteria bacterium]